MSKYMYSKINEIPTGTATDEITEGCLVMEGGAFRGIYVAAAIDALMEHGINLSCAIGVSAGALNGMNYISGQIGRAGIITLNHLRDKKYVGTGVLLKHGNIFGYDYAFTEIMEKYTFNHERFNNGKQSFIIVTTNLKTAKTEYFERGKCPDIYKVLQASSSLPYISKPAILNGDPHLDGGCSDKLPFEWALERYKKVIVIKTQHKDYRKPPTSEKSKKLARMVFRKHPDFAELLCNNNEMYNAQLDRLDIAEKNGDVLVISPSEPINVKRFENDAEKLGELYHLGYNDTLKMIPQIKQYLKI